MSENMNKLILDIDKKAVDQFLNINNENYNAFNDLKELLNDYGLILSLNPNYNTCSLKCKKNFMFENVIVIDDIKTLENKDIIINYSLFGLKFNAYLSNKFLNPNIKNNLKKDLTLKVFYNTFGLQIIDIL